jgi:protein-tyrosine phosphatase
MSAPKRKKIIFVCTGNTCRSPMAEMLLKRRLEELALKGFTVASAGIKAK